MGVMDTYLIEADGAEGYAAKVVRVDGISHSARGFISRCEAQAWVNEHRRFEHASVRGRMALVPTRPINPSAPL